MSNSKLVALTGSSGFIGAHLLTLLLANNFRIRILVRNTNTTSNNHPNIETIVGNLHNQDALNRLTSKVDYIIHCAGRVRGANAAPFTHDNIIGTKNILTAATQANQGKFIFISSLSAREPSISDYANSKHAGEFALKQSDLKRWTIIRPPAVYGPGDAELKPIFDWMQRGVLWVPGNAKQKFSLIHIDDLTQLVIAQLHPTSEIGNTIEPDDGQQYDWRQIQQISENFFLRKIRIIHVPSPILSVTAHSNVLLSKVLDYTPMLTPGKVRELLHRNWVSEGNACITNWKPKVDLKIGLGTLYSSNDVN